MQLTIIRHGQSQWNKLNLFTGSKDIDLTDEGIIEAKNCINNEKFDVAFTSNLKRAYKTCEIIKKETNQNYNIIKNDELNERDYGDLTGKNKSETIEIYGENQVKLWRRSVDIRPPNGENLLDVIKRVEKYFNNVIKPEIISNKKILIVAHGNSIRALLVILKIFKLEEICNFEIPTGKPIYVNYLEKNYYFKNEYILKGRQILDSRGNPTLEVDLISNKKLIARQAAPSGASTGSNEALELRDGDKNYFMGKSVSNLINKIEMLNKKMYLDKKTLLNLKTCDNQLKFIDGTELKTNLGGNTTTALSFAMADAAAKIKDLELFEYFNHIFNYPKINKTPIPMVNILNGGKHAGGNLKIQEFMILTSDTISFNNRVEQVFCVYNNLKKLLVKKYGISAKNLGDEGGFAPQIDTPEEALNMIEQAVIKSNLELGKDIFLALDCAASEFYNSETKLYEIEKDMFLTTDQLISYYMKLIKKHPSLKSIEDAFDEKDYYGWKKFTNLCGDKLMIVGDDLFTTNPNMIKKGLQENWANCLLLKVNQIGTISEAVEAAKMMQKKDLDIIVSHRSGETNSSLISDLAVGIHAKYIKLGAPARGERVSKFNRLIQIEELI
jgi:enolase